jgi:hypothetical protein
VVAVIGIALAAKATGAGVRTVAAAVGASGGDGARLGASVRCPGRDGAGSVNHPAITAAFSSANPPCLTSRSAAGSFGSCPAWRRISESGAIATAQHALASWTRPSRMSPGVARQVGRQLLEAELPPTGAEIVPALGGCEGHGVPLGSAAPLAPLTTSTNATARMSPGPRHFDLCCRNRRSPFVDGAGTRQKARADTKG